MLKLAGSILIFTASAGIGFLKGMELQKRLQELQGLKQLFVLLKSEIKYTKSPLGEAFSHIGRRMGGVYKEWLLVLAGQLEEKSGKTFQDLWNKSIEELFIDTKLKKEDLVQLKLLGMNMGYLDEEQQMGAIHLYLEQLDVEIKCARESLGVKRRLCNCLGVMGGLFLVVIFL